MKPIPLSVGDTILLKKPHPCGNHTFRVLRTGADIRMICIKCNRDLMLPREKAEKIIRTVLPSDSDS